MADTAVTLSKARISKLKNQERHTGGFNYKVTVKFSDIAFGAGATDTVTVTLGNTPSKYAVLNAAANIRTAFAGTGAMTFTAGTAAQPAAFIASTTVLSAAWVATAGAVVASAANSTAQTGSTLRLVFTNATSGSPPALTAGEMDVYLNILDLSDMP